MSLSIINIQIDNW